jgi:transposase-like protein
VPKHESRGLSIEKLVFSLYAKGMSVSDIEEEMRKIYEIELSTSAISIITNKAWNIFSGQDEKDQNGFIPIK